MANLERQQQTVLLIERWARNGNAEQRAVAVEYYRLEGESERQKDLVKMLLKTVEARYSHKFIDYELGRSKVFQGALQGVLRSIVGTPKEQPKTTEEQQLLSDGWEVP